MKFIDAIRRLQRRLTLRRHDMSSDLNISLDRLTNDLNEKLDRMNRELYERFDNQAAASNLRLDRLTNDVRDLTERSDRLHRELYESFDNQAAASNLRLDRLTDDVRDLTERLDRLHRELYEGFDNQAAASNLRLDRLTDDVRDLTERLDRLHRELYESFDNQAAAGNLRLDRIVETFERRARELRNSFDALIGRQISQIQAVWRLGVGGAMPTLASAARQTTGRTIIHPGFGHSGTTSLQVNFFAARNDLFYCGAPGSAHGGILSHIKYVEEPEFDYAAVREAVDDHIFSRKRAAQRIVLSDETLVEQPEVYYTPRTMPPDAIAMRLHWLFPDSVVLFTLRNQFDYVESLYFNLKRNYAHLASCPCPSFEHWLEGQLAQVRSLFLRNLNYYRAIKIYADIFGRENVFAVPLELINESGERGYLEAIGKVLDLAVGEEDVARFSVRRNARMTRFEDERLSRGHDRDPATPCRQECPATVIWTQEQKARVIECIGDGNELIEREFGAALSHYGYPATTAQQR